MTKTSVTQPKLARTGPAISAATRRRPNEEAEAVVVPEVRQLPDDTSHKEPTGGDSLVDTRAASADVGAAGVQVEQPARRAERVKMPVQHPASTIQIKTLPTSSIQLNDYNPNSMSKQEFGELVAEMTLLGRPPKPIVVRCHNEALIVVDGEHALRAAIELGMKEVPCEVVEADDFEAMRQSFRRNRHGRPTDPLRVGQMFKRMIAARGLSLRDLAKMLDVSEGTIRNVLLYPQALELRKAYAPEHAEADIRKLSIDQVRTYIRLSKKTRDQWVDKGANLNKLPVAKKAGSIRPETSTAQSVERAQGTALEATANSLLTAGDTSPDQAVDAAALARADDTSDGTDAGQPEQPRQDNAHQRELSEDDFADEDGKRDQPKKNLIKGFRSSSQQSFFLGVRFACQEISSAVSYVERDPKSVLSGLDRANLLTMLKSIQTDTARVQSIVAGGAEP
jgi:ParB-like chromosome segregation protein Spo0J